MDAHFTEVHSHVDVDFAEAELLEELMRAAGDLRAFVTYMVYVAVVRVLTGEREGLFLTLDPDGPATRTVQAVERVVR